jgi:hypothetical protein
MIFPFFKLSATPILKRQQAAAFQSFRIPKLCRQLLVHLLDYLFRFTGEDFPEFPHSSFCVEW